MDGNNVAEEEPFYDCCSSTPDVFVETHDGDDSGKQSKPSQEPADGSNDDTSYTERIDDIICKKFPSAPLDSTEDNPRDQTDDPKTPDCSLPTSSADITVDDEAPCTASPDHDPPDAAPVCAENNKWFIDEAILKELDATDPADAKQKRKREAFSLKSRGNKAYQGAKYDEAADLYTKALRLAPLSEAEDRAVMYSNRGACFIKMEQREQAIDDCSQAIELKPAYMKALIRRAALYEEKEDDWDKALEDYKTVLNAEPGNKMVFQNICRLNPMIQERNERMKEEMIGKLKDLGNMVLRPFGMTTDNFKLEPNAEGGYSVQMQK